MYKSLLLIPILLISCYSYKEFVSVTDRKDVPLGSTEFYVQSDISGIKSVLQAGTVAHYPNEFGMETELILLDEGTKAQYKLYVIDSVKVKVVPYWSYTEKVVSETSVWLGSAATASMKGEMQRVVYRKSELRPKKVFDYGVQLFGKAGAISY